MKTKVEKIQVSENDKTFWRHTHRQTTGFVYFPASPGRKVKILNCQIIWHFNFLLTSEKTNHWKNTKYRSLRQFKFHSHLKISDVRQWWIFCPIFHIFFYAYNLTIPYIYLMLVAPRPSEAKEHSAGGSGGAGRSPGK